ncbi:MAG: NAD-dependent epimerase/dehydratase family protein [Candidatus Dormibacteria bacterium]
MPRALLVGGTGMIGQAVARRLLAAGWTVDLTGRDPAHMPADLSRQGARFIAADRQLPQELLAAIGSGAELLVDTICYSAIDARALLPLAGLAGSTVMISSKAVYVDGSGNHSNSTNPPNFQGAISEGQSTVPPGGGDWNSPEGYGRNKVAAELVLLESGLPVTIIRPSKMHGRGALRPREWVFVRRALDKRKAVLLCGRGAAVDHTTAAVNLAELVALVAAKPGSRVLNAADPDAPSALSIARTIATQMGHGWEEILLDETADPGLGRHPWASLHPILLDMTAATALGYRPVGDYATTVADEIAWLVDLWRRAGGASWDIGLDSDYFQQFFDYSAEDAFMAARAAEHD